MNVCFQSIPRQRKHKIKLRLNASISNMELGTWKLDENNVTSSEFGQM